MYGVLGDDEARAGGRGCQVRQEETGPLIQAGGAGENGHLALPPDENRGPCADANFSTSNRKGSPPTIKVAIKKVGKRQVTLISGTSWPASVALSESAAETLGFLPRVPRLYKRLCRRRSIEADHDISCSCLMIRLESTQVTNRGTCSLRKNSPRSSNTPVPVPPRVSLSLSSALFATCSREGPRD